MFWSASLTSTNQLYLTSSRSFLFLGVSRAGVVASLDGVLAAARGVEFPLFGEKAKRDVAGVLSATDFPFCSTFFCFLGTGSSSSSRSSGTTKSDQVLAQGRASLGYNYHCGCWMHRLPHPQDTRDLRLQRPDAVYVSTLQLISQACGGSACVAHV